MKTLNKIIVAFLLLALCGCTSNALIYLQHVQSPNKKFYYALYEEAIGIGDPAWFVLKLDTSIDPAKLYVHWSFKNGIDKEKWDYVEKRKILDNYDEAGMFTSDAEIEIINNRYLVFSRGGYYFGLYDLKTEKDIFNDCCTWQSWQRTQVSNPNERYDRKRDEEGYGKWIKENLDEKIKAYIQNNN